MPEVVLGDARTPTNGISRRRFIGYLIAAPTLVAAADLRAAPPARASVATVQPVDFYDLTDFLTDAANLTAGLITVTVNSDGTASFALPRAEVGQGITTAIAMVIADELDFPLGKVKITLSDARPELEFNQLTGGSNSLHALYDQVRIAAAIARGQLAATAAKQLQTPLAKLSLKNGVITAPDGSSLSYGSLARPASTQRTRTVLARLKSASQQTLVGTPQPRIDALEIVTGTKQFAMDLEVAGALPTMVCRPPTINGTALAVLNGRRSGRWTESPILRSSRTRSSFSAASRSEARRSGSASTRSGPLRSRGHRDLPPASQTLTCSETCSGPSCP
jgi:isoquinoline 1-oxidoreductase subunit beta